MKKIDIPFYDLPTLERIAKAFLIAYNDPNKSEVDIELIIEEQLGWQIVALEGLMENYSIEAYVSKGNTLYMDPYLIDWQERRYRFTLAEEVSHFLIHKDIYANCKNLEEHLERYEQITGQEYWRMERNAKYLASAILMPSDIFEKESIALYEKIDRKKYKTNQDVLYKITLELSNIFNVSDMASKIRFKNLGLHNKLISL
jgi:Zn-dependent peptidase ImmA (M78 family)